MADKNRMTRRARNQSKDYKISIPEIISLNESGNASVTITAKRRIENNTARSEAQELKKAANKSPWTEDKKGRVYANKSKSRSTEDPVSQLRKFVGSLSRG